MAVLSTGNEVGYILVSFSDHTQEPGNETSHCYISFLLNIKHNKPSIASRLSLSFGEFFSKPERQKPKQKSLGSRLDLLCRRVNIQANTQCCCAAEKRHAA